MSMARDGSWGTGPLVWRVAPPSRADLRRLLGSPGRVRGIPFLLVMKDAVGAPWQRNWRCASTPHPENISGGNCHLRMGLLNENTLSAREGEGDGRRPPSILAAPEPRLGYWLGRTQ